jgi:FdhD protein
MKIADLSGYLIYPNPDEASLTSHVTGRDHTGTQVEVDVVTERGLTVYLNKQEIVTLMTLGDHPEYLALGFLLNQNMLRADDVVTSIDYDEDLEVAIVRTQRETNYEDKLKKKVRTSG